MTSKNNSKYIDFDADNSDFEYNNNENLKLKKNRRWIISLAISSGILFIICAVLTIILVFAFQNNTRLKEKNDILKQQNSETQNPQSAESNNSDENLIDNLDTTKLLTKENVGEKQIPDHYRGNKNSRVVVISYEDFACSYCHALNPIAEKIYTDYKDKVLFINRSFNLEFANSEITLSAAEAAFLAGGEDAYWKMANRIHSDEIWSSGDVEYFTAFKTITDYAKEINLDIQKFSQFLSERSENSIIDKLTRDKQAGQIAGVRGTPTWLVNGNSVRANDQSIRQAIDSALQ